MTCNVEHLFICLLPSLYLLWSEYIHTFGHFLIELFVFLLMSCKSSFYSWGSSGFVLGAYGLMETLSEECDKLSIGI